MTTFNLHSETSLSYLEDLGRQNNLNVDVLNHHDLPNIKFNINPKSQMGHWTAAFIKNGRAFYLDSFGVPPSLEIIKFFKKSNIKWCYNKNDIQYFYAVSCGYFCLAFLHYMKL